MRPEVRHPSVKRTRIAAFQLAQDGEHHDAIAPREQSTQVAQCFAQRPPPGLPGGRGGCPPEKELVHAEIAVPKLIDIDKVELREHRPSRLVGREANPLVRVSNTAMIGKHANAPHAREVDFRLTLSGVAPYAYGSALNHLINSVFLHVFYLSASSVMRQLAGRMPPAGGTGRTPGLTTSPGAPGLV